MPDIFVAEEKKPLPRPKKKEPEKKTKTAPVPVEIPKAIVAAPKKIADTRKFFSAYLFEPKGVRFESIKADERAILLLRKHPITNIPWILIGIVMIIAPIVLFSFPFLEFLPPNFQFIAILMWYLITAAFLLENFLLWFFNVNIVTNKRVVDIDFHNLLYKEVADTQLDRIQDITYKMGGALRTVFNFGDVFIQTAGSLPNFEFAAVPSPAKVVSIIQELWPKSQAKTKEGKKE